MQVIPLKYGTIFKRVFSQPDIFCQFAQDILGIEFNSDTVHTEYEYPEPVGFVRSKYDLFAEDVENRVIVEIQQVKEPDFFDRFLYYHLISLVEQVSRFDQYSFERTVYTIVVLTSTPRDGSIDFSWAMSDMNPINEKGEKVDIYPHRLAFLCPRQTNEKTPANIKKWLDFIADSLDGEMNEKEVGYQENIWQKIIANIEKQTIDPDLLAEIKDDMAWEEAKRLFLAEGKQEGREEGRQEALQEMHNQQRQTVLKAQKMGLKIDAIAELTGLSLEVIENILKTK